MGSGAALPDILRQRRLIPPFPPLFTAADLDSRGPQAVARVLGLSVWANSRNVRCTEDGTTAHQVRWILQFPDKRPLRGL